MNQMVVDVVLGWEEMAGSSDEVRKLNSLLTSTFIGRRDLPSDECLSEAEVILKFWLSEVGDWKERAVAYLKAQFATAENLKTGESRPVPRMEPSCVEAIGRAERLLKGGLWPDRPMSV